MGVRPYPEAPGHLGSCVPLAGSSSASSQQHIGMDGSGSSAASTSLSMSIACSAGSAEDSACENIPGCHWVRPYAEAPGHLGSCVPSAGSSGSSQQDYMGGGGAGHGHHGKVSFKISLKDLTYQGPWDAAFMDAVAASVRKTIATRANIPDEDVRIHGMTATTNRQ